MALPAPAPDRTCLITGASAGIGTEFARQLAAKGYGLTLVARREDRLKSLAEELSAAHGIRAEYVAADLTDEASPAKIVAAMDERGLSVDVLINNAGFSTLGPVSQSDPAREVAMIRTDVEAVVHLCSVFVPGMVERGRGAVLNVASTASYQPMPGQAGYAASKAFVRSYTHALRAELSGSGVTAAVLCPGPVETEFGEVAGFSEEDALSAMPKMFWVAAAQVAKAGLDGLAANRAVVIPGLPNRITALSGHLTPPRIITAALRRMHPAMKGTQH